MKTVTIAAYDRPECLKLLLESLSSQMLSLNEYELYIRVDAGGKHTAEVLRLARSAGAVVPRVERRGGINRNTYETMRWAFEVAKADYNVYLEDDFILSPDTFNLVEWYIAHEAEMRSAKGVTDVGTYCLCVLPGPSDRGMKGYDEVWLRRSLFGWGFVMNRHQWKQYARPVWSNVKKGTWDKHLANYIRSFPDVYNAVPGYSRISNTGRARGTSVIGKKWDRIMRGHTHNTERRTPHFRLMGVA